MSIAALRAQSYDAASLRRRLRAGVIVDLLRHGWRPPPLTDEQTDRLIHDIGRVTSAQTLRLTENELDVLARVARGDTVQQIADDTSRSYETIKKLEDSIRSKLGARNAAHAVAVAMSQDILGPVE